MKGLSQESHYKWIASNAAFAVAEYTAGSALLAVRGESCVRGGIVEVRGRCQQRGRRERVGHRERVGRRHDGDWYQLEHCLRQARLHLSGKWDIL